MISAHYDSAFQALRHGDCAPVNILLQKGLPVFIDFEFASFRHSFVDLTTWYMFYPLSDDAARTVSESHRDSWTTFPGVANQVMEWSDVFATACTVYGVSALSCYLRKGGTAAEMLPEEPEKQEILLRFMRRLKMACLAKPAWEPFAASSESLEKGILAARRQPEKSVLPVLWACGTVK